MVCKLCSKNEAVNFIDKEFGICDSCHIEIVNSFSYHIGTQEVTKEEYEKRIKNG